jgi:hypothetical protein
VTQNPENASSVNRSFAAVAFGGAVLCQIFLVIAIHWYTPMLLDVFADKRMELPAVTVWYIDAYRFSFFLPIATIILAGDILRRSPVPFTYSVIALIAAVVTTLLLQAWALLALRAPFFIRWI